MKLEKYLILASAILIGAVAGLQAQDQTVSISPQAVTFALTTKSFVGGTFEVDPDTNRFTRVPAFSSEIETLDKDGNVVRRVTTEAARAVTGRMGNAQILAAIVDSLDGTTSGWSIVLKTDEEGNSGIWAVKRGQDDVSLSEIISFVSPSTGAYNVVQTYSARYNQGDLTSETTTYAASGTIEGPISMSLLGTELVGAFVQPYRGMTFNPDSTDKSVVELAIVPGAGRVTGVIGSQEDEETGGTIYGGTINIAAARGTIVKFELE